MTTRGTHHVGVDVGGTFTDMIAVDAEEGRIEVNKRLTTPEDPSEGVRDVLAGSAVPVESIAQFVHGSTTAVNAVIERTGATTGLLTTEGFRDVLQIGRLMKPELYSLDWDQPEPLVPRRRRRGVPERLAADGSVVRELDEAAAREAVRELRAAGTEAYAVCFLFSFLDSSHEERMREIVREVHPEAAVSISAETLPEIREFQRTSTVVANAYLLPVMDRYFSELGRKLGDLGVGVEPLIMRSNGGVMDVDTARRQPIETFDSGPAGGVTAAASLGRRTGRQDVIAFDMGGTSCEVGVVADGEPAINLEGEIEFEMPIRVPVVDVDSIGAGGGSVAWIDDTGLLQVGPRSAGADPGPVCYGRGGEEPTITDANVLLGRLSDDTLLGGDLAVDVDAAEAALGELADGLGMDRQELCRGIMEISETNMAMLARKMTVERGYDPRGFAMVAYGGAGPMVAASIAGEIGVGEVVVPPNPGVFSAYGCMSADLRQDEARSYLQRLEAADPAAVEGAFARLADDAREEIADDGDGVATEYRLDLRYVGEAYEITTPHDGGSVSRASLAAAADRFHELHEERFAHKRPDDPVEIVSLRATATRTVETPEYTPELGAPERLERRDCYFEESGFTATPVYNRAAVADRGPLDGPAVVEEPTSTTVVPPGATVRTDGRRNLVVDTGAGR
jgi:N-methylhydantoinase A